MATKNALFVLALSTLLLSASVIEQQENETSMLVPAPALINTDPVTGMEFVPIKGGCYDMGDNFGDGSSDEQPVRQVCVDDFSIGKYAVTQEQWRILTGSNPSFFAGCGAECPVETVSWNDIQDYIRVLNQRSGGTFRLPTEAEWEYAARSGGRKEKFAGTSSESELGDYAWYRSNSNNRPHPVGRKKPNGLGIHDMSGNVWEWTADWYDSDYYKTGPKDNPRGPSAGSLRVLRGGSWNNEPGSLRTSCRYYFLPDYRVNFAGFRLVKTRQPVK